MNCSGSQEEMNLQKLGLLRGPHQVSMNNSDIGLTYWGGRTISDWLVNPHLKGSGFDPQCPPVYPHPTCNPVPAT